MTTCYLKKGNIFKPTTKDALNLHERLPVGTYTVLQDAQTGEFYLEAVDNLEITGKMYGSLPKQADRILNTFMDRPGSTGVLLNGDKGTGKTLLSKLVSTRAREKSDIPTLIINQELHGEQFNSFIQGIDQPAVVIFDEFEKIFDHEAQQELLTLLDGVYPTKKLFILTCNRSVHIDDHMINRPGRIYYIFNFDGLEKEFIEEYCRDNLKDQSQVSAFSKVSTLFNPFTFDIMKAMVEEMNRYDETPQQVLKVLNAQPKNSHSQLYTIELVLADPNYDVKLGTNEWNGNPLSQDISIGYEVRRKKSETETEADESKTADKAKEDDASHTDSSSSYDYRYLDVGSRHLKKVSEGKFIFIGDKNEKLTLTRKKQKELDPFDLFRD